MLDGQARRVLLRAEQLVTQRDGLGFNITLAAGDRIGILGSSGSGKTTLLRVLASLRSPVSGRLYWNDVNVARRLRRFLGKQRFFVALLFANPYTSLEPWAPVRQFVGESHRTPEVQAELLRQSRIPAIAAAGYVRSLSGVERIRLSLTYTLQNAPRVVLVDDVFRMVVPEIWGQLFAEFDAQVGETRGLIVASRFWQALSATRYLFVLYKGNVVEWGSRALVFSQPRHPYTQWLLEQGAYSRNNIAEMPWAAPDVSLVDQRALEPFEVTPGHWARWC